MFPIDQRSAAPLFPPIAAVFLLIACSSGAGRLGASSDGAATGGSGGQCDNPFSPSPPEVGTEAACPADPTACEATFAGQVARRTGKDSCDGMSAQIVAGTCGAHQVWRKVELLPGYDLTECVYDAAGALELSVSCNSMVSTCRYGGRVVALDACPDLGPDYCGSTPLRGETGCLHSFSPPPEGTDLGCPPDSKLCDATYAEQVADAAGLKSCGQAASHPQIVVGACGYHQAWQWANGFESFACAYDSGGNLEFSETCTDTGCSYGGRVVRIDATCAFGPDRCAPADAGAD